jgi:hypothetical protein
VCRWRSPRIGAAAGCRCSTWSRTTCGPSPRR